MISVLICSINPGLLQQVSTNIEETIGTEYEIVSIDNRTAGKGICSVYNILAARAKFSYLCFIHEDIKFTEKGWGKALLNNFSSDPDIGLIGVAGSKYKSSYFSGWFANVRELDCANYIHQYERGFEKVYLSPDNDMRLQEVVCIDGVFMCCKRQTWESQRFDEKVLSGFHFYDIDFSLRSAHACKVVVSYNVDLIHITSGGDYGNNWVETAIRYHHLYKNQLPFSKVQVDKKLADKRVVKATLDFLKNYDISFGNKVKWIRFQKLDLFPDLYYDILKLFFYKPLRLKKIHNLLRSK